jgi:ubiquinone/menaquinone biosynthesis C-methylase UbiE
MAEISNFTQPGTAPAYFIDFLDFLDNHADVKNFRAEIAKRMNVAAGHKVLDLGCGGLAAGVDISSALIEVATGRAAHRPGLEFRVGDACAIPYPEGFFDVARTERVFLYLPDRLRPFTK